MAEEKSAADKLMDRIQQQAIVQGIKEGFKRFPQARFILPMLKNGVEKTQEEINNYLGDAQKCFLLARKNNVTSIICLDATKKFSISTGLEMSAENSAIIFHKTLEEYIKMIGDSGLFNDITDADMQLMNNINENGIGNVFKKEIKQIEQIASPNTDDVPTITDAGELQMPSPQELKQIVEAIYGLQLLFDQLGIEYKKPEETQRWDVVKKWQKILFTEENNTNPA